jgi:hypothetical protein
MGVVTTLSEASASFASDLQWDDGVGPLSGKTIVTVIVFLASWVVLGVLWRRSNPPLRMVTNVSVVLIALGLLLTFPTFFQAFE